MKTCLIVEDDFSYALEVEMILKELNFGKIDIATSIEEIKTKLAIQTYSLIVSDIKLGQGAFSYDYFNSIDISIPIIYTSVLKQESVYKEVQKKRKHLYLVKPIGKISMMSAVESVMDAHDNYSSNKNDQLTFRVKGQIIKKQLSDINYIQSQGNYCTIHCDNERYTLRKSLQAWVSELDDRIFVLVHRSYIVNLRKVERIVLNQNIVIVNTEEIPVGRKYRKEFMERF